MTIQHLWDLIIYIKQHLAKTSSIVIHVHRWYTIFGVVKFYVDGSCELLSPIKVVHLLSLLLLKIFHISILFCKIMGRLNVQIWLKLGNFIGLSFTQFLPFGTSWNFNIVAKTNIAIWSDYCYFKCKNSLEKTTKCKMFVYML